MELVTCVELTNIILHGHQIHRHLSVYLVCIISDNDSVYLCMYSISNLCGAD